LGLKDLLSEDDEIETEEDCDSETEEPDHVLSSAYHNVVTKMRNLIKLFKSSPARTKSKKQLSLDVKTRWNSLETSVSTFLELLPQIKQVLPHKSIDKLYMWDEDETDAKRLQVNRAT
jgi:hypothetical protein